jgi:hypothetical protein
MAENSLRMKRNYQDAADTAINIASERQLTYCDIIRVALN